MIRYCFFIISGFLMLLSCTSSSKNEKEVVSTIAADQETPEELAQRLQQIQNEEKQNLLEEKQNITSISFETTMHDFGKIRPNTMNTYKFQFKNTGKKPLIIDRVTASCGCTTPHKPDAPILPGKSEFITVEFQPKPSQKKNISKTVVVESNTTPKIHELTIQAFIAE